MAQIKSETQTRFKCGYCGSYVKKESNYCKKCKTQLNEI